jgi:hypothetical protein
MAKAIIKGYSTALTNHKKYSMPILMATNNMIRKMRLLICKDVPPLFNTKKQRNKVELLRFAGHSVKTLK